jgi:hypothetical protein
MDLGAPFAGTLYLPDKKVFREGSPVQLATGETVAVIRWTMWTQAFDITDPDGAVLAQADVSGFLRRRFEVRDPTGDVLIRVVPGFWSLGGTTITLGDGRMVTVRKVSAWSDRRFEFYTDQGLLGRVEPTTHALSFRPDSYVLTLERPELSPLQAIAMAQAQREIVRAMRSSSG